MPLSPEMRAVFDEFGDDRVVALRDEPPVPRGPEDYGSAPPEAQEVPILPLPFIGAASLQDNPIPDRKWLVHNRIPMANVTLLNGDGAAGKTTIALQLAAAVDRGTDWLGGVIDHPGPVLFMSAEEDHEEIHRRLSALTGHYAIELRDLASLQLLCIPGQDATLCSFGRDGIARPTLLYQRLERDACEMAPTLIVLEAAADLYPGNENDRAQVRQFIGLLRRVAIKTGAAILLLAHPSLTGLNSGTGTSGSTAWNNSVRSRLYFTSAKPRDGDEPDADVRELRVMKSNYGPAGETVRLRWQRGVFVPEGSGSNLHQVVAEATIDETFLTCLDLCHARGVSVSAASGSNFAPAVFERMPEATGLKRKALGLAMARLFTARRIRAETFGPPSKQRQRLARVEVNGHG